LARKDEIRNEILRKKAGANPWEIQHAFDTIIGISNRNTIFKDYCYLEENFVVVEDKNQLKLEADLYETNKSNLSSILPKIEGIINNSAFKDQFIGVTYVQENPTVMNDEALTIKATTILNTIYGEETVIPSYGQVPYFNDDFIYFQQKVPGVYFLLGGSNVEKGIFAMNHTPNFRVDEECIKIGVQAFSSLILERCIEK